MLCQRCRKNQATVKVTTVINGQKTETHLCEDCARKAGEMNFMDPGLTIQQLLANLLAQQIGGEVTLGGVPGEAGPDEAETPVCGAGSGTIAGPGAGANAGAGVGEAAAGRPSPGRCPTCGMTFNQFRQIGRLGCGDCYRTFDRALEPLLQRIHGGHLHGGKVPRRIGGEMQQRREIAQLKEQMSLAVAREDFEKAAVIRDRLRDLEKALATGGETARSAAKTGGGGNHGGGNNGGAIKGSEGRPGEV